MSEYTTDQVLKMMEEWHAQHPPEDAHYPFRGFDLLAGRDLSEVDLGRDTIREKAREWSAQHGGAAPPWLSEITEGIDLGGAVLSEDREGRRANLAYAHLQGARLVGAHLQGARLVAAQLQGAWLVAAQLQGAWLEGVQLQGAGLVNAQLQGAWLEGAELKEALLQDVDWGGGYVLGEEMDRNWTRGEEVYRGLKGYYTGTAQYQHAGEFHKREMLMRRKGLWNLPEPLALLLALPIVVWGVLLSLLRLLPFLKPQSRAAERAEKPGGSLHSLGGWLEERRAKAMDRWSALLLLLLGLTCGYGERPSWAVGWTLASWLAFALAYFLWASLPFPSALFFSALAFSQFTPPGNSFDHVPEWARTAALAESVLAYFFLALFLVTFVRKTEHL